MLFRSSAFFLGEIYVDLPLPLTAPETAHCGQCQACMDLCPTGAIVGVGQVDARRCISYLTIEHPGPIPEPMRPLLGNRIYGCDDCQLACPWNKFAQRAQVPDFDVRPALNGPILLALWRWDEPTFLRLTEGSPIRRIGHMRWRRNLAVAMGNALGAQLSADTVIEFRQALHQARETQSPLVREHIDWALSQVTEPLKAGSTTRADPTKQL